MAWHGMASLLNVLRDREKGRREVEASQEESEDNTGNLAVNHSHIMALVHRMRTTSLKCHSPASAQFELSLRPDNDGPLLKPTKSRAVRRNTS